MPIQTPNSPNQTPTQSAHAKKSSWLDLVTSYLSGGNYGTFTRGVRGAGGALEIFESSHSHE